jgi:hypothetical protein
VKSRGLLAAALLGGAAVLYAVTAWSVRPGFYDGLAPPSPYRWVSPPPSLAAGNQAPLAGHGVDPVLGGSTAPFTTYTNDGQVIISFLPASFRVTPGTQSVTIRITPEASYPTPTGFTPATNVYLVTATAPLVKAALIQLQYSNAVPSPSYLYGVPQSGGSWKNLGASNVSAVFTLSSRSSFLGYFVAGYSKGKPAAGSPTVAGGQVLPIVIAAVILLVLVAGVPLALLRRGRDEEEEEDEPAS